MKPAPAVDHHGNFRSQLKYTRYDGAAKRCGERVGINRRDWVIGKWI
jgi:hypothetical protein